MYASLRKVLSGVQYHARAKMLLIKPKQEDNQAQPPPPKQRRLPGMLCVVSCGPEDQAAVDQVKLVAEHLGCFVSTKSQLSVQNLQGLIDTLPGEEDLRIKAWAFQQSGLCAAQPWPPASTPTQQTAELGAYMRCRGEQEDPTSYQLTHTHTSYHTLTVMSVLPASSHTTPAATMSRPPCPLCSSASCRRHRGCRWCR